MRKLDYIADDYIAHFGILGMKWGIRRYQNKDGSLTSAGRKRYGYSKEERDRYIKEKTAKGMTKEAARLKYDRKYGKKDEDYLRKIYGNNPTTYVNLYNSMAAKFNARIHGINSKFDPDDPTQKSAYDKAVLKMIKDVDMEVAKEYGASESGRLVLHMTHDVIEQMPRVWIEDTWSTED